MNFSMRALLAAALLAVILAGCGRPAQEEPDDRVLTILAADELRDLEALLPEIAQAAGEPVAMTYTGSLAVVDRLVKGDETDLAWPAHGGYLALFPDAKSPALAQEKIMRSPVVVGVKASLAAEWGWANNPNLTWRDVAERAAAGDLKFAMPPVKDSQAGISALLGVSAALLGRPDALQESDLTPLMGRLGAFLSGQALQAQAGELARRYLDEQDRLTGIIDYEATLLQLNRSAKLDEPLALIYPREGILTADYPLLLINGQKRAAYTRLVNFLRSPEFQQKLMEQTLRRPANPQVALSAVFPQQMLVELPFPSRRGALEQLRAGSPGDAADLGPVDVIGLSDHARHLIFVVDVSASMRGARLDELKTALLAALEHTGAGTARVTILAYHHEIALQSSFEVDPARPETLQTARGFISGLQARGGTASYTALLAGYEAARRARKMEPGLPTRVILITDGRSTQGMTQGKFLEFFRKAADLQDVPTLAVVFGEGRQQDFEAIAKETGGNASTTTGEALEQVIIGLLK